MARYNLVFGKAKPQRQASTNGLFSRKKEMNGRMQAVFTRN
jgi:hypothetical protein